MAYNPFNIFRRNQKAIFAVVTVVIMFMFVLSSGMTGKADFFNWLPEWIGSKSKTGEALCEIDGKRVYPRDIETLRFQRVVANKFMGYATGESLQSMRKALLDLSAQASPENSFIFQAALQARSPMEFLQFAGFASKVKDNPKSKEADKNAAAIIEAMANLMQSGGQINRLVPMATDRDMIEFMMWQKKAKQLGIQYSADDAKSLVNKEFMGNLRSDVEIRKALRDEYRDRYTDDILFTALAAEFDVRAAYTAVVGLSTRADQTLTAPVVSTPPYEMFDFYRDKTSPTSYQALRVPVEAFIPMVNEQPSDNDLQRLFQERKDYEPDPAKEEAGFREPRKVKVEWVSVNGDEPYYKKAAADWQSRTEMLAKSEVRGLIVPFPGAGIAAAFHIAAPAAMKEPLVHEKYKRTVDSHESRVRLGWTGPTTFVMPFDILETNVVKPQNLAAAAGGAAGAGGFGNILAPASLLYSASIAAEQKARIKACMPLFMGAVPGPAILQTMIGGEVAFRKAIPEALPLEAYKPELLKELSEGKARELAVNDLKSLKESIDKLTETGKAREAAAKALVDNFVKTRGVKTGASADFHGEYTIGDDPGLAPLKTVLDKQDKDPHAMLGGITGPVQFGKAFFWKSDRFSRSKEPATGTYLPEFYPERAAENATLPFAKPEPVFLAWRTADQAARGSSFTEAKPRVIEAWKRIKARDLAKAEAERLAAELRNKPGDSEFSITQNMSDLQFQLQIKALNPKARELVKSFRIDNVAPYQITRDLSGMSMGGGGGETIVPFRLAPTNEVPFPTADMTKQLLDDRTKPIKTVFVMIDQPKDSYYVTVVSDRRERSPEEFRAHAYGTLQRSQVGGQVAGEMARVSFGRARDSILALLKKEFKYVETDEQKKRLDDKQKSGFDDQ